MPRHEKRSGPAVGLFSVGIGMIRSGNEGPDAPPAREEGRQGVRMVKAVRR
jgi:hypothetical protein